MFKIGDKVRRINCAGGPMSVGQEGIVIDMFDQYNETKLVIKYEYNNKKQVGIYSDKYYRKVEDLKVETKEDNQCDLRGLCEFVDKIGLTTMLQTTNLPERYIINDGATILFWDDDTKTIVKKTENDSYDKRLGFLYAYFQKTSGLSKNKANKYIETLCEEPMRIEKGKPIDRNTPSSLAEQKFDKIAKAYMNKIIIGKEAAAKLGITLDQFYSRCRKIYGNKYGNRTRNCYRKEVE